MFEFFAKLCCVVFAHVARTFSFAEQNSTIKVNCITIRKFECLKFCRVNLLHYVIIVQLRPAIFNIDNVFGKIIHKLWVDGTAKLVKKSLRWVANSVERHAIDNSHSNISFDETANFKSRIFADKWEILTFPWSNFEPCSHFRRWFYMMSHTTSSLRLFHCIDILNVHIHHLRWNWTFGDSFLVGFLLQFWVHLHSDSHAILHCVSVEKSWSNSTCRQWQYHRRWTWKLLDNSNDIIFISIACWVSTHLPNSNIPRWIPSHRSFLWMVVGPYWRVHASHLLCNSLRSIRSLASDAEFFALHRWMLNNATIKRTISAETWCDSFNCCRARDFTRFWRKNYFIFVSWTFCLYSVYLPIKLYSNSNPSNALFNSISCKRSFSWFFFCGLNLNFLSGKKSVWWSNDGRLNWNFHEFRLGNLNYKINRRLLRSTRKLKIVQIIIECIRNSNLSGNLRIFFSSHFHFDELKNRSLSLVRAVKT